MSINSSVCSINKNASLFDAINIIINENIEELLVWDESLNRWIWMLTIVDAIRLIMHSLKTIIKEGKVSNLWVSKIDFTLFQQYREEGMKNFRSTKVEQFTKYIICWNDREQIMLMLDSFQKNKIGEIILEINEPSNHLLHHESQDSLNRNKFA